MKKLVAPAAAADVIDLDAPTKDNLAKVAKALGKDVNDLVVFVLDKPRHKTLISEIRAVGARIQLHTDGDVSGALMAVDPRSEEDLMMGMGGTLEGVISACAIQWLGGQMLARLDPQSEQEKVGILDAGISLAETLSVENLVRTDEVFFAATGISGGTFMRGVAYGGNGASTYSVAIRGKTGTVRYMEAHYNWDKLMKINAVAYD
jgi:fructose-1,6-bisphosphatase II